MGLGGWVLENEILKRVIPGWVTMKVTTAIALVMCAFALFLSLSETRFRAVRMLVRIIGAAVGCFGLLVIAEYVFGLDLGFDSVFFRENFTPEWTVRGRPSPSTALNFVLVGTAFFLINGAGFRRNIQVVKSLGFTVAAIGFIAIAGYLGEAFFGYRGWIYTGMAFHTALSFFMLGLGLVILTLLNDELRWSVSIPTTLVFFSGLGLMVLAAEMTYAHTRHLYDTSTMLTHREEVLKELQEVEKGISNLQGEERNFLITADETFLGGRPEAVSAIWGNLQELKSLTGDNPLQQARVLEVGVLLSRWLTAEDAAISARRSEGLDAAVESLKNGGSMIYRQNIEAMLASMEGEEIRLRGGDRSVMRDVAADTFLLLPLEAFLGSAIFLVALFSLDAGLRKRDQAERHLREALKKETDLRNAIGEHAIVAITDTQGRIEFINDKFCLISGYSREELIGQDHRIINSGHHPHEFFRDLWAVIQQGNVWKGEIKNRAKDGSAYWVAATIVPFLGEDDRPTHFVGILTDITQLKVAEESLRHSEACLAQERTLLRTLLDTIPDLIFIKDQNCAFAYCNKAFEEFFGKTSEELKGLVNKDVFPPEHAAMAQSLEMQILETLQSQRSEKTIVSTTGRRMVVETVRSPLSDAAGNCIGLVGISRDITDRRLSEARVRALLERLRIALQASGAGIWELDLCVDEAVWDDQMFALYGVAPDMAEKGILRWYRRMHPDDIDVCKRTMDDVRSAGKDIFEVDFRIFRSDNGELRFIRSNGIVKRNETGEVIKVIGSNRDVTEERKREQELADAVALQKNLVARAQEGEKAKGQFLATMSHELRTPMNGILGFIQLLGDTPGLSRVANEYTAIIRESAESLLRILDDILDFSRMDAGRLVLESKTFSPRQLVTDVHRLMVKQAEDRGLRFEMMVADTVPDRVKGDPGRIRQILLNLIGNAIKFTPAGSVTLEVLPTRPEDLPPERADLTCFDFRVKDTGIGISQEKLAILFKPFVQGDSSISRRFGGTGLGLSISRKLAECMGGSIFVQSEEGQGSCFTARLHLESAPDEPEAICLSAMEALDVTFAQRHPLNVMVVEDDRINLLLIQSLLRRLGYESSAAENGKDAIGLYQSEKPNCILTDLQMPVMDGVELTREIRSMEKLERGCRGVAVIAVTANILPSDRQLCASAGMDDYLNKPIKVEALASVLAEASRQVGGNL
ncbi:PAS domain S-box-containing protein [Terrimicrobium sacchariphilum]|uniref:histidine kinase n=1 Tax=Terrimicrobium sacchariphilum TaxID=690879 RepID=A0A146G7C2_TERSA|nr:PAS domain S-box-containing protein [Terrimicrobium sacchariphilum]